jgi:MoaA/NifB/PqqE/SkfB family radical SAM enzyme
MKCGAFDSGLTIHPDGKVTPCCLLDINLAKNINELDWKDPWKDLRDGQGCAACKKSGNTYKDAFDIYFNDRFAVRFLDVRNNNLCNMECVICGPYYSSKWAERTNKEQRFVKTDFNIDLGQVRRIYFAGGEPFLNKTHWDIIKNISNPENVGLVYSSNLTYIKGVQEYFPKFDGINFNASLDGIGKFGEQVRPGLDWKTWQDNLDILLTIKNVQVEIACTVSLTNIWHLRDIDDFAKHKGVPIRYYALTHPNYFALSVLPPGLKDIIDFVPTDELRNLLNNDDSHLFKTAIANILLGDRVRGTNLWDYLPFKEWAIKNILDY